MKARVSTSRFTEMADTRAGSNYDAHARTSLTRSRRYARVRGVFYVSARSVCRCDAILDISFPFGRPRRCEFNTCAAERVLWRVCRA